MPDFLKSCDNLSVSFLLGIISSPVAFLSLALFALDNALKALSLDREWTSEVTLEMRDRGYPSGEKSPLRT